VFLSFDKVIPYVVTIKTGNKRGAGTDANVFLQLYGVDGKSEEYQLRNKSDNFERNKEEIFKIEADDVGPLYKVRIGHDNKGMSSAWFLEQMHIQRHAPKGSKKLEKRSKIEFEFEFKIKIKSKLNQN
jgi:lipoxygenase homology domain-containing protein 1